VLEATLAVGFLAFLTAVQRYSAATPMKKKATLNMAALNRVNVFKECFLGYVNAGMLEPILAIASSDYDVTTRSLLINLAQLGGLSRGCTCSLTHSTSLTRSRPSSTGTGLATASPRRHGPPGCARPARGTAAKAPSSAAPCCATWRCGSCSSAPSLPSSASSATAT